MVAALTCHFVCEPGRVMLASPNSTCRLLSERMFYPAYTIPGPEPSINAEMDPRTPFALLLVGQPTLARQLRMGIFAALDQHIATRYQITPMDLAESAQYLRTT